MKNDGGPAFPITLVEDPNGGFTSGRDGYGLGGASLRDYFAAKALQGWMSNSDLPDEAPETVAKLSYRMADAMIAERDK